MKMGRAPCCSKNSDLNRGAWTAQEDLLLSQYIKTHGEGRWRSIRQNTGLKRCGKSCRLRWLNYLRPDIKRGDISPDEEDLILRLHGLLGNRWSLIAGRLPSRTDNEIKNYWNTHLSRKINLLPKKKTLPKHASPDPCGRGFQSSPVKVTAVRIKKGRGRHNSSSGIFNHQENGVPQAMQICNSIVKEDNSESTDIPMDNNNDKSQSLSMKMDGQIQIQHSELFSSEFDACTRTDMTQLLDHNIHANSYRGNDEEENREGDWVEELQHQQQSCLQWLSLLLESEEDWEERTMQDL